MRERTVDNQSNSSRQEIYSEVIKCLRGSQEEETDANILFGQYVGATLKDMGRRAKEMAKIEIQQVLVKYLFESVNE